MMRREPAWRLFAQEYMDATHHISSDAEHSPLYVITPLGARVNRLFVVGALVDVKNYGTEDEPSVSATLSDSTGHFYLRTGQYNPEVGFALLRADTPSFVAVVGKVHVYQPEGEDVIRKYVRPEAVIPVEKEVRDRWLVETARATRERMEAMSEAMQMESPSEEVLRQIGIYPGLARGVVEALSHYDRIELDQYSSVLGDVLRYVMQQRDLNDLIESGGEDIRQRVKEIILSVAKGETVYWADIIDAVSRTDLDESLVRDEIDRMVKDGIISERQIGVKLQIYSDDEFWQ